MPIAVEALVSTMSRWLTGSWPLADSLYLQPLLSHSWDGLWARKSPMVPWMVSWISVNGSLKLCSLWTPSFISSVSPAYILLGWGKTCEPGQRSGPHGKVEPSPY